MPLSVSLYPDTSRYLTICEGATVTLTCVTDTGTLRWSTPAGNKTFTGDEFSSPVSLGNNISVELTDINVREDITLTSELIIIGALLTLNGSFIACQDNDELSGTIKSITIHISGNISSCSFACSKQTVLTNLYLQ